MRGGERGKRARATTRRDETGQRHVITGEHVVWSLSREGEGRGETTCMITCIVPSMSREGEGSDERSCVMPSLSREGGGESNDERSNDNDCAIAE